MSKNILREYEDGFFNDDEYDPIERLKHKVKKDPTEKEQTLQLKKLRESKHTLPDE